MSTHLVGASLAGLLFAPFLVGQSPAREIVGNRLFPAPLTIDDPGVNDELAVPTVDNFKTGDEPPFQGDET